MSRKVKKDRTPRRSVDVIIFFGERGLAYQGGAEKIGAVHNGNYLGTIELLVTVELVNRNISAVKRFQTIPVNRLTDGELCSKMYNIFMNASIDSVVDKGPFKNQSSKTAYIDTNTNDRIF